MARRNADVPPPRWIQFRIGINLGDVIVEGYDIPVASRMGLPRCRRPLRSVVPNRP
jgi:hypothetical protein